MIAAAAARFGGAPAVCDGDTTLSYRALAELTAAAGRGLASLGVDRGDRVAIWAPNTWEWIVAALGAHRIGATLVPINTRYRGGEAADVLARSAARLLFTVSGFLDADYPAELSGHELPALEHVVLLRGDGDLTLRDLLARPGPAPADRATPDDVGDLLFTSGTTGRAKAVPATHAQSLRAYRDWAAIVGLRPGDRYLVVAPFFHTFGYKAGFLAAFMTGATVYPQAVFDAAAVLARIPRDRIGVLPGPPALYQTLLARPDLRDHDLSSLRLAVTGAAVIPVELVRRMREELGFATVITGYGLTEATGIATMCRAGDDAETVALTSGRPVPGVEVAIRDDGEIAVRGYNVMRGYVDDPAATAETIDAGGWLATGDVGALDARGNLRITDRKKDMFIVGGFNAYPAEIERVLAAHPGVAMAAVVGAPDPRLGEVGVAFVVARPAARLDAGELHAFCRERMANFKVPRRFELVDALPLNASGKVQKFALRERLR
jgi:acyl-CoA synthetase (AMP-forming)/AMP-acid ligase II